MRRPSGNQAGENTPLVAQPIESLLDLLFLTVALRTFMRVLRLYLFHTFLSRQLRVEGGGKPPWQDKKILLRIVFFFFSNVVFYTYYR